jgi:hypothetical protein
MSTGAGPSLAGSTSPVTSDLPRSPWLASSHALPFLFGACSTASVAFLLGVVFNRCGACSGVVSPWLPFMAASVWLVLSLISRSRKPASLAFAAFFTMAHAGFAARFWYDSCVFCLTLLTLEFLACLLGFLSLRGSRLSGAKTPIVWKAGLLVGMLTAPLSGMAIGESVFYADCRNSPRSTLTLSQLEHDPVAVLITSPGCSACRELERQLASDHYLKARQILQQVDKCSAVGRSISRNLHIRQFPTLVVFEGGSVTRRALGVEEVVSAVRNWGIFQR